MMAQLHWLPLFFPSPPSGGRRKGEGDSPRQKLSTLYAIFHTILLLVTSPLIAADVPDLEERTREIAAELRCVVCQNLSIADSPSEMAQQMRAIVREQLQAGKTPQEIKDFFVSKYGEWVLLKPSTQGFGLVVWVVPFVALVIGLALGIFFIRRWTERKSQAKSPDVDAALLERVRQDLASHDPTALDLEDQSPRSQLRHERARLYADLKELEFDFRAGKLSDVDYAELRHDIESKAATVLEHLDRIAAEASTAKTAKKDRPPEQPAVSANQKRGARGWRLAAGGAFLLIFGLALGVILTNSLRPRGSEQDSITGDFLTGTSSSGNNEVAGLLREGKTAFGKQEFPKAIDAFKKILDADPNQPEAHAYMGFILMQAGHADGALMAFDRALSQAPNFPMALWGKGMTLYQGKKDYAGARGALEKLLTLMPQGEERNEVAKVLAEIPATGPKPKPAAQPTTTTAASSSAAQISGKITIDPKLKDKVDGQASLFIIARAASAAAGPPLAVKKFDKPTFPLNYSLSSENVMMQGTPFAGKVTITVRLDKDGNAATRGPGDLSGDYKKNPVEVGTKNIDIVIDKVTQ